MNTDTSLRSHEGEDVRDQRPGVILAAALGSLALVAQVASSLWDQHRGDPEAQGWGEVPVLTIFGVIAFIVAYVVVRPRVKTARGALVTGVIAVALLVVAFWNPAPVVFGAVAIALGRERGSRAAIALGGIAVAIPLVFVATGPFSEVEAEEPQAWCEANQILSDVDPTAPDPTELERNVAELRRASRRLPKVAPNEIRAASQTISDEFPDYLDQVEAADYDITKVDADGFFNDPDVATAGEKLNTYADAHCPQRKDD